MLRREETRQRRKRGKKKGGESLYFSEGKSLRQSMGMPLTYSTTEMEAGRGARGGRENTIVGKSLEERLRQGKRVEKGYLRPVEGTKISRSAKAVRGKPRGTRDGVRGRIAGGSTCSFKPRYLSPKNVPRGPVRESPFAHGRQQQDRA